MITANLEISKTSGLLGVLVAVTDANGDGVTDAAIAVQLSRLADGFVFDWDSAARIFKSSAWTTKGQAPAHNSDSLDLGAGLYYAGYSFRKADGSVDFLDGAWYLASSTVTPSGGSAIQGPSCLFQGTQAIASAAKSLDATVVLDTGVYYLAVKNVAGTIVFRHPLKDVGDNNISAPTAGANTAINAAVDPA